MYAGKIQASPDAFKNQTYPFTLPALDYTDNAFGVTADPTCFISEDTIITHHQGHHAGYVNKLNTLVNGSSFQTATLEQIVRRAPNPIFNQAAQHYNHSFYWKCITPTLDLPIPEPLNAKIIADFGNVADFKTQFANAAKAHFGSGWVWLVATRHANGAAVGAGSGRGDGNGNQPEHYRLRIVDTHDASTPIREGLGAPLLCIDIWEHAYYIDRRNLRSDYVDCFMRLVDWGTPNTLWNNLLA